MSDLYWNEKHKTSSSSSSSSEPKFPKPSQETEAIADWLHQKMKAELKPTASTTSDSSGTTVDSSTSGDKVPAFHCAVAVASTNLQNTFVVAFSGEMGSAKHSLVLNDWMQGVTYETRKFIVAQAAADYKLAVPDTVSSTTANLHCAEPKVFRSKEVRDIKIEAMTVFWFSSDNAVNPHPEKFGQAQSGSRMRPCPVCSHNESHMVTGKVLGQTYNPSEVWHFNVKKVSERKIGHFETRRRSGKITKVTDQLPPKKGWVGNIAVSTSKVWYIFFPGDWRGTGKPEPGTSVTFIKEYEEKKGFEPTGMSSSAKPPKPHATDVRPA